MIKKFPGVQELVENYPYLRRAVWLEGQFRHLSKQATGLVITNENLNRTWALYHGDGQDLICWDHGDFERVELCNKNHTKQEG